MQDAHQKQWSAMGTMIHFCTDMWFYLLDKQVLHELASARCLCEIQCESVLEVNGVWLKGFFFFLAHMKPFGQGSLTTKNTKTVVGTVVA